MDFLEWLKQMLDNYQSIGLAVVGVLGVVTKAIGMYSHAAELHDKNFVRRRLERLLKLTPDVPEGSALGVYLDDATEREKFRIASGISVSPAKMRWLMQLDATGVWSRDQVKAVSKFLVTDPKTSNTAIHLTASDKILAWFSIASSMGLLLMGSTYFVALASTNNLLGFLSGAGLFVCFIFVGRLFSADFINYRITKKIVEYLDHHPLPTPAPQSPHPTES